MSVQVVAAIAFLGILFVLGIAGIAVGARGVGSEPMKWWEETQAERRRRERVK